MSSQFRYTKVLVLVIESAMIYSAALLVEITLYFIGSNAFYIVYDPIAQLTVSPLPPILQVKPFFFSESTESRRAPLADIDDQGIVPTMIIVMSALGLTSADFESAAASRRDRDRGLGLTTGTHQMSTMRFGEDKAAAATTVMSLPGLTTDNTNTTSASSYESREVLGIGVGKDSGRLGLPEVRV